MQRQGQKGIIPKAAPIGNSSAPGYPIFHAAGGASHTGPRPLPSPPGEASPSCSPFPAGFIDFIVEPTFSVLTDVAEKSVQPLVDDDSKSKNQPR